MGIEADFDRVESFDGTELAWTSSGEGDVAVVFANGILCTDTYWSYLYPHLVERGRRVVFWDYRGHGRSGPPRNPNEVTVGAHAQDLLAVADAAGVERAVLVGHSMGVQTILEAYRAAPERVAGLVAVAGPYEHPGMTFYGVPFLQYAVPMMEVGVTPVPAVTRAAWRALTARADLMYWSGRATRLIGGRAPRALMDEYFAHLATLDPVLAYRMVKAMDEHSAKDLLPSIEVPTLVMAGARDVMSPPRLARAMVEAIPDAELAILAAGAHTLPVDDPAWINDGIGAFVDRLA